MFGYNFEKNRIANFQEWRTASKRSSSQGKAWANASNVPFREYKKDVHEGGSRTPLIAHWPARIKDAGGLRHDAGHIIDIMATACEIGRADMPEKARGLSLSPTFDGNPLEGREALYWEHEGNRAIRVGDWKLVSSFAGGKRGDWELYDLASDLTEMKDLAAGHQEKVAAARGRMDALGQTGQRHPGYPREVAKFTRTLGAKSQNRSRQSRPGSEGQLFDAALRPRQR